MIINHDTIGDVNAFIGKNKQIDCRVQVKESPVDAMRVTEKRYQRI